METVISIVLIFLAITFTICHLIFRYAPREYIFKIKPPITIHHKKHTNGSYIFPPFHYLNKNGIILKNTYIGSALLAASIILLYLLIHYGT